MRKDHRTGGRAAWIAAGVTSALLMLAPVSASGFEPADEAPKPKRAVHPKMVEEARTHFIQGMKHYDEGAYPVAKADFEKAYELAPNFKLLYNLGLVYGQVDDPAGAIKALEGYLAQGAWEVPDSRVTEVTKLVSELTPRVASAKVVANVPAVQVTVDDKFAGQTPIEEVIVLNPGQHTIVGKHDGRSPDTKTVATKAGEMVTIQLELKELPVEIPYARIGVLTILFGAVVVLVVRAVRSKTPGAETPPQPAGDEPGAS